LIEKVPGYTKFDNKLLEKLARSNLSGREIKIMLCIIRKLDGFHKVEDRIPQSQIVVKTGIAKQHVSLILKGLERKRYIYKMNGKIRVNKEYDQWDKVTDMVTLKKLPNRLLKVTIKADKKVTDIGTSKETQKKSPNKGARLTPQMTRKEVDKLEGKPWLKAEMEFSGKFTKRFINQYLGMAEFTPLYDAYYELGLAYKVRDYEAWLIAKLVK